MALLGATGWGAPRSRVGLAVRAGRIGASRTTVDADCVRPRDDVVGLPSGVSLGYTSADVRNPLEWLSA